MEILNWLLPLAAVFPLIYLLRIWLLTKSLLGLRFGAARFTVLPLEATPAHLREAVAALEPELRALGFEPARGLRLVPHSGEAWTTESVVFQHVSEPTSVSLLPNPRTDCAGQLFANVVTFLTSGIELHTTNYQNENVLPVPPKMREEVLAGAELTALVGRHRERVAAAIAAGDPAVTLSDEVRLERLQVRLDDTWQELRDSGLTTAEADGRLVYKFTAAWKTALRLMREEADRRRTKKRTKARALPPVLLSSAAQVEFDHTSYRRMIALEAGRLAWLPKTVIMLVSLATFSLVLGWKLSLSSVFVLLAVLIFHEGGHLLGMRWFGHRDTQLLFLPFLGGAAVALDHRVLKPWQHLVILFLGPLPGLFIGFGLLVWAPQGNHWVQEFTWMLIALNGFNLLPILPLDGGQIMDNAFITRFPRLRLVFLAVSGLGLLAVTVLVHGGTMLGLLGVFTLLRLPVELKTVRLLRALRRELAPNSDEDTITRRLLTALRGAEWAKIAPVQRLQLARAMQRTLEQPLPGWGTVAFAAAGYLSPLWVPVAALLPFYGVGVWQLHQAEDRARADGLVTQHAPATPVAAERDDHDFGVAKKLIAAQQEALLASLRKRKGETIPEETKAADRAELVAAIRLGCARVPEPGESDPALDSQTLFGMAGALTEEVRRLAAAGETDEAARVIDDQIRLLPYARMGKGFAAGTQHLQVIEEVLNAIESLIAVAPQPKALQRWSAVLDESRLRAEVDLAYRAMAQSLVDPVPAASAQESSWLAVFTWVSRWPATRATALEKVRLARAAAAAGDFNASILSLRDRASGLGSFAFNAGTMQVVALRAQTLGLVCRQRLARAAIELREKGLPLGDATEMLGELTRTCGSHPVTNAALVIVRDARGVALRFGPRPVVKAAEADAEEAAEKDYDEKHPDDLELLFALREIEWWLTEIKPEQREV